MYLVYWVDEDHGIDVLMGVFDNMADALAYEDELAANTYIRVS